MHSEDKDKEGGNYQRAMKHFMLAARVGNPGSLEYVKKGFNRQ